MILGWFQGPGHISKNYFGNVPWTLKSPYLEMHPRPWKQTPPQSTFGSVLLDPENSEHQGWL